MRKFSFRRQLALVLAMLLTLPAAGIAAKAVNAPFVELVATDVTLDETEFTYTGQEIRPNVTVRSGGKLLTLDEHYYLDYADNIEVGEARVIITGIATGGYAGTVEHPFFIREAQPEEPEFTLITLTEDMVTLEPGDFAYTGEAVEPMVTVTVNGQALEQGRDYAVEYVNNLLPGTGTSIIRGIATASETLGYTGEVRKNFTILPLDQEAPGEPSEPSEPSEPTDPSQPSEPSQPTEPAKPVYTITKGDKSSWTQGTSAALSFTSDGPFAEFEGVSVDGKKLDKADFEAKEGTVVLLKNAFLKELKTGSHTITLHFAQADASGTFTVVSATDNPKTGDTVAIWLALLITTGTALVTIRRQTA